MKKEEAKKIVLEGIKNGGFTLKYNGEPCNAKNGYSVSELGYEKTYLIDDMKQMQELENDIILYSEIAKNNNAFIGGWINNGVFFLDISKVYNNLREAKRIAKKNKQLAIYDIKNGVDIQVLDIFYTIHDVKNDFINKAEYNTIAELEDAFNIKNAYQYIINDIDAVNEKTKLLKDKYIICKNEIEL